MDLLHAQISPEVSKLIDNALSEDQAFHDSTTDAIIGIGRVGSGLMVAKTAGVLAGVDIAFEVFRRMDSALNVELLLQDGSGLQPGGLIARVEGNLAAIIKAERTALNFLQRMSGIATETHAYVLRVRGCKARIVDTRKTAPGLRYLDKYAVRAGGGTNHRLNLADGILIKDNHIAVLRSAGITLEDTVRLALERARHTVKVEVEVTSANEAVTAVEAGAHIVLLDNMALGEMRDAVLAVNGRAIIEASGGINLENVRSVAETGVDLISVGALTHSSKALDISLDVEF
jgi:nicotinate-nucleotide pyrophosphorylase (carboxylating)